MVEIRGIEDMRRAVEELTADLRRKVVLGALRDALKPALARARALVSKRTGLVRGRIGISASKIYKGQQGVIGAYLGVRKDKGRRVKGTKVRLKIKGNDPYYYKFLELGTKKMRARPFLKPAGEQTWQESLRIFQQRIAERIAKANRRV